MSRKMTVERDLLAHHAEQHEHVGDHHRGEQLEEVLDPQVHDPEAPELGDREVVAGAGEQARRRRTPGSRSAARKNSHGMLPRCSLASRRRRTRQSMNTQTNSPTESSTCQSRARSRYSKPCSPNQFDARVLEHAVDRRGTSRSACRTRRRPARRAARRRACPDASARAGRSSARGRCPRRRTTSTTQNSASCTCQVRIRLYGKTCGEIEAEEVVDLRAIVLRGRADAASGSGTARPSRRRTTHTRAAPA